MSKRIMVDMSATLIHHGHIRLLKKAAEYGTVIVGLTTDDEILSKKGYHPELLFNHRKEVLESIKYVDKVVATPWLINDSVLEEHKIDLLVHGHDNSNLISNTKLLTFPRTEGISSTVIRQSAMRSISEINNQKLMLTPGPAVVLHENLENLKPLFGRGDDDYSSMADSVMEWIKTLCGQDKVIMQQGSATFALELAAHSFVEGKILLVSTGYYSDRLKKLLPKGCKVTICNYENIHEVNDQFDWVLCAYTETSTAFKVDLKVIKNIANSVGALLYVDATGSIGLEDNHHLADVMAFSSCKGLFGLTGASFIAHKANLSAKPSQHFYFNMETQENKMVTGPYHAVASLFGVIKKHAELRQRVINSKEKVMKKWSNLTRDEKNQPLLCTYIEGEVNPLDKNIVLYSPRSELSGSVICHFGEIHSNDVKIDSRIEIRAC
jgi:cytidyltransferase-like protein